MKYFLLVLLVLSFRFPSGTAQIDKSLLLPKRDEIARITIPEGGWVEWFTKESLWEILPGLAPIKGTYLTKTPFQKGTLELKNGTTLTWMAFSKTDLMLYSDKGEQLYRAREKKERELFPINVDGKMGFIDVTGKVVIEPQFREGDANGYFEEENYFKDGLAMISEDKRGGFIDKTGKFVISGPYYPHSQFSDGLARVADRKNQGPYKIGFMNKAGKFVIRPQFDEAEDFSDGLAVVEIKGKWGYINKTGRIVIPLRFDEAASFHNGFALVDISAVRRGYIDKTGAFLEMPDGVEAFGSLAEGMIAVKILGKWGFIDTRGQIVIEPQFEPDINESGEDAYAGAFADSLALAKSNKKWGYIDTSGKPVIRAQFDKAKPFEGDVAAVCVDEKWGLIDKSGKFLATPQFERVEGFAEGFAVVSTDGKTFGYIDVNGKIVIPPRFTGAESFSEGLAAAQVPVKVRGEDTWQWGYIDKTGKFVIQPKFDNPGEFSKGLARQLIFEFIGNNASTARGNHDQWGYINRTGKYVWKSKK